MKANLVCINGMAHCTRDNRALLTRVNKMVSGQFSAFLEGFSELCCSALFRSSAARQAARSGGCCMGGGKLRPLFSLKWLSVNHPSEFCFLKVGVWFGGVLDSVVLGVQLPNCLKLEA